MKSVVAIILSAGSGKRLGRLTQNIPKCLLRVGCLPILNHQLNAIKQCGIKDVVLVTGFKAALVERHAKLHYPDLNIKFARNADFERTNTLYSLLLASCVIRSRRRQVLQLNGDVVFDSKIIRQMLLLDSTKSYVATQVKMCGKEEIKVVLDNAGMITSMNKTVNPNMALGEAIGINKFSPSFWAFLYRKLQLLKNEYSQEYFEFALERIFTSGRKMYPFIIGARQAIEIDYPHDLETAENMFKD